MHVGFARLLWPRTDTHTNTHSHTLFSEASPALETLHTHTHTHAVKVRGFAKLQQTGSQVTALPLLPLKLVKAGCFTGSGTVGSKCWQPCIYLFFISLHV